MTCVQFTIPGRPTAWQRAATFKGRKITPKAMANAQKTIGLLCRVAMGTLPPMEGPLKLEILAVYAIPPSWPAYKQAAARAGKVWKTTVPDWDNLAKQIGDALNEIGFIDDAQIVTAQVAKRYGYPERTEVRLTLLDGLCDHSPAAAIRHVADGLRGQPSLLPPPSKACHTQSTGGPRSHGR
jgi:Holliday junction resolvase RusA-like endonuclease